MAVQGNRGGADDPAARAIDALERAAVTGLRVARSLHGRWRRMSAARRTPLQPLAEDVRERALDLRGEADRAAARHQLRGASERLAEAIVASAAADPDVSDVEVRDLRADLARELARLADADIEASRGPGSADPEELAGGAAPGDGQA